MSSEPGVTTTPILGLAAAFAACPTAVIRASCPVEGTAPLSSVRSFLSRNSPDEVAPNTIATSCNTVGRKHAMRTNNPNERKLPIKCSSRSTRLKSCAHRVLDHARYLHCAGIRRRPAHAYGPVLAARLDWRRVLGVGCSMTRVAVPTDPALRNDRPSTFVWLHPAGTVRFGERPILTGGCCRAHSAAVGRCCHVLLGRHATALELSVDQPLRF